MNIRQFKMIQLAVGFVMLLIALFFINYFKEPTGKQSTIDSSTTSTMVQRSIAERLRQCLPMSDMESKRTCDELIKTINSFEGCVSAGFPIMKTNPEQCQTPDNRTFKATRVKKTFTGTFICLPYRNTSGPHNDLCAFGIKTPEGNYAIDTNLLGHYLDYGTGENLLVSGYVTPVEELNSNTYRTYDIKGILSVTEVKKAK